MRHYVRSLFVRDWQLKLVSLGLALGVWLLLVPAEKKFSEKSLTIPLETRNVPAGLEIVERPAATIDITLRAPNRLLDEIGPSGLVARIDLDRATVLQQEYPLNTSMIAVPPGAEVVKISPGKVTIKLERTAEATVDVHPTLRGRPAPGFRVARTEIEPASVVVQGPESRVKAEEAATTAPIDISGLAESTVFEADIILPRPELRLVSMPTSARVTIHLEPDKAAARKAAVQEEMSAKKKLFGTDGVRAVAGTFPLDPPTIARLGTALVELLERKGLGSRILIGRDTRESGPWMERALARGVRTAGGDVVSAGVIPTSAVSFLTKTHGFAAGAVISASHNPFQDNGIKVFSPQGIKIPDEWELEMEAAVLEGRGRLPGHESEVGLDAKLTGDYVDYLVSRVRLTRPPAGLRVVVDCANGASSAVAPRLLAGLGFEVEALNAAPDGTNINAGCGSLHPEGLAARVRETGASIGVAYDGDADRALWVDRDGRLLSGDHTLFVQALHMKEAGRLRTGEVVATTMSNMGLERALEENGIGLVRTKVGDKYVHEEMVARGANLGGEQSGHTIFLDDFPTGDGLLTSLRMLEVLADRGGTMAELVAGMTEFPQTLVNVRVRKKPDFAGYPEIMAALEVVKANVGRDGQIDLRYSGTEPLARVMVEARDRATVDSCAMLVADAVRRHLGEKN